MTIVGKWTDRLIGAIVLLPLASGSLYLTLQIWKSIIQ